MPSNSNNGNFNLNFFKNLKKLSGNYGYLICSKCYGYYLLKENESLDDFLECECGNDLEFYENIDDFIKTKCLKGPDGNNSEILDDNHNELQNIYNALKTKFKIAFYLKSNIYNQENLKTILNHDHGIETRVKNVIIDIGYMYSKPKISKDVMMLIIYLVAIVVAGVAINYSQIELGLILIINVLFAFLINLFISRSYSFFNLLRQ